MFVIKLFWYTGPDEVQVREDQDAMELGGFPFLEEQRCDATTKGNIIHFNKLIT